MNIDCLLKTIKTSIVFSFTVNVIEIKRSIKRLMYILFFSKHPHMNRLNSIKLLTKVITFSSLDLVYDFFQIRCRGKCHKYLMTLMIIKSGNIAGDDVECENELNRLAMNVRTYDIVTM